MEVISSLPQLVAAARPFSGGVDWVWCFNVDSLAECEDAYNLPCIAIKHSDALCQPLISLDNLSCVCHVLSLLDMQTKASRYTKEAQSTTTEEFQDIMKVLVNYTQEAMKDSGFEPMYSWDNNKIQAVANLQVMGITQEDKLPLSKYSPDLHKVIEHAFAQLKNRVRHALLQPCATAMTPAQAQRLVGSCFQSIPTEAIFADVCSLPTTYLVVSGGQGEVKLGADQQYHVCSGGDWPERQYR